MRLRPIWCKTCDRYLWPWQKSGRWYSRTIHAECADVLNATERELDRLVERSEAAARCSTHRRRPAAPGSTSRAV